MKKNNKEIRKAKCVDTSACTWERKRKDFESEENYFSYSSHFVKSY